MASAKYISHWNEAGQQPYHRYSAAGISDHVTESVFGIDASGEPLNISEEGVLAMIKAAQTKLGEEDKVKSIGAGESPVERGMRHSES